MPTPSPAIESQLRTWLDAKMRYAEGVVGWAAIRAEIKPRVGSFRRSLVTTAAATAARERSEG